MAQQKRIRKPVGNPIPRTYVGRQSYLTTSVQQTVRALFAFSVWTVSLWVIPLFITILGPLWGFTVGSSIWILAFTQTLNFFLVSVPEVCGLVTINLLLRPTASDRYANMHVYPTGLSFIFPWEQVKLGLYINLRIVTQPFEGDFPAKSGKGVAGGGPKVEITGSIQYRALLELLPRYIAVDESTINQGLFDIITSYLSVSVARREPAKARTSIEHFQKKLVELFESPEKLIQTAYEVQLAKLQRGKIKEITFEWLYAIDVLLVRIGDAEYEPDYQQVLTSQERALRIQEIAQGFIEKGLSPKDASNAAFITTGDVTKAVTEIEGNAWQALQGILINWGTGNGGPSRRSRRSRKQPQS